MNNEDITARKLLPTAFRRGPQVVLLQPCSTILIVLDAEACMQDTPGLTTTPALRRRLTVGKDQQMPATRLPSTSNLERARQHLKAIENGADFETLAEFFSPDIVA